MMTSKSSNGSGTKRQRTSPYMPLTVNDLSADLCCIIADFLPKTSRALLAVALTAPPASFRESGWKGQPNAVSKAIISSTEDKVLFDTLLDELCEEARGETDANGNRRRMRRYVTAQQHDRQFRKLLSEQLSKYYNSAWEILDFVDIPVTLASRLNDDDLGAVLLCIDAKNNLERLNLTHCFNVVGYGFIPLRASDVLEKIDLGLYRQFETPFWRSGSPRFSFREVKLSEGPVCDILDSILSGERGNSLRRLQYPYEWYEENQLGLLGNIADDGSIDQLMRSGRMRELVKGHNAATLNLFSCCVYFGFGSNDGFCSSYDVWKEDLVDLCLSCQEMCFEVCSHCNEILCATCNNAPECRNCNVIYCQRCQDANGFEGVVTFCENDWCDPHCSTCRSNGCRNGSNNCSDCKAMVFDTLLEECNVKQAQIDSQQEEMERSKSIMFTSEDPPITIRIKDMTGETLVTVERSIKMEALFQAFATKKDIDVSNLRFTLCGETIHPSASPESLDLYDMVEIEADW